MLTIRETTTLVGISELRTKADKILKAAKEHKVIIRRRNKPVAVLMDIDRFDEMERVIDTLEDAALGYCAQERDKSGKKTSYLDFDEAERRIRR